MIIEILTKEEEIKKVLDLIKESFDIEKVNANMKITSNPRFLVLKQDGKIIATSMLTEKYDPVRNIKALYLDYVCVDKEYQHKGYGKKLYFAIENIAKEEKYDYIELTSNPKRVNAREMYLKVGMEIKDTDVFIKKIS